MEKNRKRGYSMIHAAMAVPLLMIGWLGFSMRKSVLGGATAVMVVWQGVLSFAALYVFQKEKAQEGAVLLWFFAFGGLIALGSILILGLRQYYSRKNVRWDENKEIRH